MASLRDLILGEFPRTLDARFRMSLPPELLTGLFPGEVEASAETTCILAKEWPGCLSLWNAAAWQAKLNDGLDLVRGKIQAGRLEGRLEEVQLLGRLLSTRHRAVPLAGRGRLSIPEGFREFLQVEASGDVILVGAAICVEIWSPAAWLTHLESNMGQFRRLLDGLSA